MEATRPAGDRRGAPGSVLRLSCPPLAKPRPAHRPTCHLLAVFMPVMHALPAGPKQPPKQPATPTKQPPFWAGHGGIFTFFMPGGRHGKLD